MISSKRTVTAWFARTLTLGSARGFLLTGVLSFVFVLLPLFSLTRVGTYVGLRVPHASALTSDTLNFQARLQTSNGAIAGDGTYNVQFKLYSASTGGTALWTEDYLNSNTQGVRVANGYLTVNLGSITSFPNTIPWDQQLYVTMNIGGTTTTATWDGEMNPRLKLTAVPYAMNAKTASSLTSSTGSNIATLSIAAPTSGNQTFVLQDQGAAGTYNIVTNGNAATLLAGTFIQNQSATVQTGNINIASVDAGTITVALQAVSSQTADLLQFRNSTGTATSGINAAGELYYVNSGYSATISNSTLTADRKFVLPDTSLATTASPGTICVFNGSNSNCPAATGSAYYIHNDTALQPSSNFHISGVGQADTSIITPLLDATAASALNIGTTNATSINLNQNTILAAGKSITITGGNTASRPASPTEGMVYYDTATKQLLTYANGKWQADKIDAILVAASNSSDADKAAADYVGDGNTAAAGDGDQVQINQALTAATGKKVVLLAGTYTIDASISIPNNTTLSGIGQGTLITIPNALNVDFSAIVNTDTTTGTNITLRDLKLDGNKANQSGAVSMAGVDFNNMGGGSGATARQGARITNVQANNWYGIGGFNCQTGSGICLFLSSNNTLTGNTVQGNSNGISLSSSSNNTLTGNTVQGNSYGIHLFSSSNNTLTGNTVQGNSVYGISLSSSSNNTLTGNTAQGNSVYGISLSSSSNNTIGSNKLHDNGGATNNSGIYLNASDSNTITGNDLTDTSCTTTCYAIDITASATKNYLEANRFSGSPANAASINDLGTGTIYAGQQKNSTTSINSDVSDFLFRGSANSTTAFNIQNASGVSVMNIDTTNGELELGNYNGGTSPVAGKIVLATTANANTVTLASAAQTGSYTLSIPALTANADICTSLNNCSNLTSTSGIQNQNTIQQSTSNFWISGTGRADTSVLTPTLDTATATILNIGTTNATSINLNQNTILAAGKSITITGGNTASRPASPTEGMVYYDTTTKQLLTYANGKWQADKIDAILVAASNSSDADKAAADYVGDGNTAAAGDGDQVQINQALTAATGKKVVLLAGTYTIDASISIPNNTTLSGIGQGTLITIPNALNTNFSAIVNTDQITGTNVTLRDLRLDGNRANQSGSLGMAGVEFNNMGGGTGATARQGARITNVQANNWYSIGGTGCQAGIGVCLKDSSNSNLADSTAHRNSGVGIALLTVVLSSNNTISANIAQGNGSNGILINSSNNSITGNTSQGNSGGGIAVASSSGNSITGNTSQGNSGSGISASSSSNATIAGNAIRGNGSQGITLTSASNNTLTSNTVQGDGSSYGIYLASSSANNTITGNNILSSSIGIAFGESSGNTVSGNNIADSGGATANDGIKVGLSVNNTITGNTITDTSCTTTCYAIDITASATKNYLEANRFSGSPANAASINDLGTGTIYAGQQKNSTTSINSDVSDFLFRGSANSTTAFNIQNASGVSVMNIDTTNGELELGNYNGGTSPVAGKIVLATTANANTVTLASAAQTGSYTLSIPALTANADICTSLNNCSNLTSTSGIQNQNTIQQSTSNFWISGTGRADTSVLTPTLDTATATILNIGTTTATSLLLGRTTTTTTVQGSLTVGASAGTGTFMNNGATINTEKTYGNFAAGGAIDTAANSVDKYTYFSVAQTTTGQTITLPTPTTNPTSVFGRIIHVSNIGSASFTIGGSLILPGYTATFVWSNTDGAAAGGETWQYAGDGGGSGSYIQNQTATTQTGGFNINGAGTLGGLLTANAGLTVTGGAINLNTASNFAVNIASTSNTVAVNIGNSANVTNIGSNATYLGTSGGAIVLTAAAQSGAAAGNNLTIKAGAGGTGNQNGGTLTLSGGDKSGTGVLGLVSLNPTAFASSATQVYGTTGVNTLAAGFVDNYSTIPATASVTGVTMVIPDPALNTTVGRILYVSATSASQDFTLRLNSTRAKIDINLKANSTATLIWNGTDWTAAGASSATDLQAAYNNTQTAAGGAEIVLNSANAGAGLTIRNSGTPITGALFEVQSSIAANLFSVNNSTTEYALNGGAESATFTGNWAAIGAATVSQNTTLSNVASGLASVNASISGAGQGAKDTLSTSLPAGVYVVSFAAKVAAGTNTFNAWYSNNGTAQTATCDSSLTGTGYTITQNFPVTTSWTKVSCFITVPAGATSSNAILIANTANASFYIDNLSVISNAAGTTPANVQIGGGTTGGQPTLFTLDQFAGPPMTTDTAAYYGSMYYDTTKNAIQCYQKADTSGVWGACGSAPDDIISMTPEYTGAVLNGSGVGTMTADFCGNIGSSTLQVNTNLCSTVGEARNFYRWTSPQATAQTYGIYVTYRLPSTFKSFKAGTMSLTGLIDSTSNAGVTYSVFRKAVGGGITQCSADTTNISSANTWTAKGPATDITASSCAAGGASAFVAGDTLIIRINVSAQSNANAYVENLTFQYSNK